jgi:tetratricopeptide (TPR) repeat protein
MSTQVSPNFPAADRATVSGREEVRARRSRFVRPGRFAVAALLALGFALGSAAMARSANLDAGHSATLDAERTAQLEHGTVEQRVDALAWIVEHGDQTWAHEVVLRLKDDDSTVRGLAEQTLWTIWMRSGSDEIDGLMEQGVSLMGSEDYQDALTVFNQVAKLRPTFAEGFNKRATLYYLMGDYLKSIDDVEQTLKYNPEHFGALSGGGLCMLHLSRPEEALRYFERALAINPNMDSIRFMAEQIRKTKPKPLI